MGKVKDFAMTHAECPVCGRCFLPWESGSLQFCGHPDCNNERDQLFEEIADSQCKEEEDGDKRSRSGNGKVD